MPKDPPKNKPNDNMKVIAVMARKGGSGKTTLVRALMSAIAKSGRTCLALDADPQRALIGWAKRIELKSDRVLVEQLDQPSDLQTAIDFAWSGGKTDYIIIDTQGAGGQWADDLAVHADHIVCPVMLTETDFDKTMDTFQWYQRLRDRADDSSALPTFTCVVSRVPRKATKSMLAVATKCAQTFPVLPIMFMERGQHADADAENLLHELADKKRNGPPFGWPHAKNFDEAVEEAADILKAIEEAQ